MHARTAQSVGRASGRGFTLTELIVAIGAVLLVSYGVGQIFSSVGQLTSYGRASAEIDAMARQIEQRLREDFEGFARMKPEDTFMAIRMREIGDYSRDADSTDAFERPIYLTPEDLEADQREGLQPYEIVNLGSADEIRSKAVTRRLDEILFFARAPEGRPFVSQQIDPSRTGGVVTAPVARIYWGHALRPQLDANFDPENSASGYPERQWTPDGDFGMPANPTELYSPGEAPDAPPFIPRGRNRYAGEWILARQPMLMFGGLAAGHPTNLGDPIGPFPIGVNREFAPFINDLETLRRYTLRGATNALQLNPPGGHPIFDDTGWPDPRLITWGRVDICAQDERDVRRWFEGQAWYDSTLNPPMAIPSPASPFSTGFDSTIDFLVGDNGWLDEPNGPTWMRTVIRDAGSPEAVLYENLRGLRSAIAGAFTRLLADDLLTRPNRMPQNTDRIQSEDNSMDFHAILSSRCSNFEIAWSDGRRAVVDINYDQDADDTDEIKAGDLIWFDGSPALPPVTANSPLPTFERRNRFEDWRQFEIAEGGDPLTTGSFEYTAQRPRVEVPGGIFNMGDDYDSPTVWGDNILMVHALNNDPTGIPPGTYSTAITGGERDAGSPTGIDREPNEMLNIWGFRLPTADGGYGAPWVKPAFIRVRITLHDDQFRIPGGKSYEFIFSLRPESSL